jgi:hypothetical protein
LAKTYTFARQLERELGTTQKLLVDANRGAERNAKANWQLAGHVNKARAELAKWQALAGQLAEALTFWDVNHPAFAAYEAAKAGSLPDPLAEAVKRMEAVPMDEMCNGFAAMDLSWATLGEMVGAVRARLIQAAQGLPAKKPAASLDEPPGPA